MFPKLCLILSEQMLLLQNYQRFKIDTTRTCSAWQFSYRTDSSFLAWLNTQDFCRHEALLLPFLMATCPHLLQPLLGSGLHCSALMDLSKTWVLGDSSVADTNLGVTDLMKNCPQAYAVRFTDYFTSQKISCTFSDLWLF